MYTHGFFYDAAMFRELGLEVPNTWDDLMDVCETLKENGIAPVTLDGTTDLYLSLIHILSDIRRLMFRL